MRFPLALSAAAAVALGCGIAWAADAPAPPPASAAAALKDTTARVTLDVQNVPLDNVLRLLSKQFGLSIIAARSVDTAVSARFKDVSLEEALHSLVTINGFAYRVRGSIIEVYAPRAGEGVGVRPSTETFELQYANAEQVKELLRPFLSTGTGKIQAVPGTNTLIVYDLPETMDNITKVIQEIDRPEPQVTIAAEIVEASMDVDERLGIDWQTRIEASGAARPITFPFSKNNSRNRFVPSNDPTVGADAEFVAGDSFPFASAEDFTFGTLNATGLKAVLEVLKTDDGTNLIANPEITTLNNHEAKINLGNTVPVAIYTTNLETGVSAVTGFEEIETGTILTVTPQVNMAAGLVKLHVKPEISEILEFVGQFDERPIVASRKAETTVRLKDGETLVIGGLVSERTEETISKVPILGDAPIIGWFFKSKTYVKEKSSLYIFVTPRILKDEAYRDRARRAADRLKKDGLKGDADLGADDLRNPGASPFE